MFGRNFYSGQKLKNFERNLNIFSQHFSLKCSQQTVNKQNIKLLSRSAKRGFWRRFTQNYLNFFKNFFWKWPRFEHKNDLSTFFCLTKMGNFSLQTTKRDSYQFINGSWALNIEIVGKVLRLWNVLLNLLLAMTLKWYGCFHEWRWNLVFCFKSV